MNLSRRTFLGLLSSAGAALAIQPGILIGDPDEIITAGEINIGGNQWAALDGIVHGPARVYRLYVPARDNIGSAIPCPITFTRGRSGMPILSFARNQHSSLMWEAMPGMEIVIPSGQSASLSTNEIKSVILFERPA